MQQQIALWPQDQEKPRQPDTWKTLDLDIKNAVIVALARLIAKAVCPQKVSQTREDNDDRQ